MRPAAAKRPARRLLKKELSLDTYSWQKKYAHLTSSVMMAQVDERLKRRFSVSTSMEEISKIAEMKNIGTQQNIGNPEQAALAQSQHFDQLEALWNKRSPPRRRMNQVKEKKSLNLDIFKHLHLNLFFIHLIYAQQSLSRQSSLAEDRINSSDEDEFLEERSGTCSNYINNTSDTQPNIYSRACNKDTCFIKHHQHSTSSLLSLENNNSNNFNNNSSCSNNNNSISNNQPDLLKEVLAQSSCLKTSHTENDLKHLTIKSASFDVTKSESFSSLRSCSRKRNFKFPSDSINFSKSTSNNNTNSSNNNDENRIRFKRKRNPLARSCISQ